MTEQTADTAQLDGSEAQASRFPRLDYEGDPTHGLRVPELRLANATLSRTLGRQVDVLDAVTAPTADRWDAMAHIAWVIAKRSAPNAPLGLWTNATAGELSEALQVRPYPERAAADQEEEARPPTVEELEDQAREEGPTVPTASPS